LGVALLVRISLGRYRILVTKVAWVWAARSDKSVDRELAYDKRLLARIILKSIAPFEGPAFVRVSGGMLHLGRRLAELIKVQSGPAAGVVERKQSRSRKGSAAKTSHMTSRT
jgi:Fe2+ transport system protein FeoA